LLCTAYANNGGIIGRGVLIDWYSWAQENNIHRSAFQTNAILLSEIQAIVKEKSIKVLPGDILFIRVGFTAQYNALSIQDQQTFPDRQPGGLLGLEANRDSMRWLWESRFAAIASDAMGFERGPATGPYNDPDLSVHQWALAGWGMPIGEMFDLEVLAEKCAERGRWTFFLCSVPLKVSQSFLDIAEESLTALPDPWRSGQPRQCRCHLIRPSLMPGLISIETCHHATGLQCRQTSRSHVSP
jgi:hypothetical protein